MIMMEYFICSLSLNSFDLMNVKHGVMWCTIGISSTCCPLMVKCWWCVVVDLSTIHGVVSTTCTVTRSGQGAAGEHGNGSKFRLMIIELGSIACNDTYSLREMSYTVSPIRVDDFLLRFMLPTRLTEVGCFWDSFWLQSVFKLKLNLEWYQLSSSIPSGLQC